MARYLMLFLIIALCHVVRSETNSHPKIIEKLIFNITMKNETFIPSPKTGELVRMTNSGLRAQMICVVEYVNTEKLMYCYLMNTKPYFTEFKLDFLPSSLNFSAPYNETQHKLDYKIFEVTYNPFGIEDRDLLQSIHNKTYRELVQMINQSDNKEYLPLIFGKCPVLYGIKHFSMYNTLLTAYWMNEDIDIDIDKNWSIKECFDEYNSKTRKTGNLKYSRSRIIINDTAFSSSTESAVKSLEYNKDFNGSVPIETRINATLVYAKRDKLTEYDMFLIENYLNVKKL